MDKETLSNYGWIVICVLVLAVMIALATPFGNFVANAVKSTTAGLFSTSKNALNSTGLINVPDIEFVDDSEGYPVKIYQPYVHDMGNNWFEEFVFHKDGSMDIYSYYYNEEIGKETPCSVTKFLSGNITYGENTIESPIFTGIVSDNKNTIEIQWEDNNAKTIFELKPTQRADIRFGSVYELISPDGEVLGGIILNEDGSMKMSITNVVENEFQPGEIVITETGFYINGHENEPECWGVVSPDGTKIGLVGTDIFHLKEDTVTE